MGFQWVPIEIPFRFCSVAVGGFLEDGTSLIDSIARGKPLSEGGKRKIKCEVNDFHSERMNSPPQTSSLRYWAQASLRYPIMAEAAQKYFLHPRK